MDSIVDRDKATIKSGIRVSTAEVLTFLTLSPSNLAKNSHPINLLTVIGNDKATLMLNVDFTLDTNIAYLLSGPACVLQYSPIRSGAHSGNLIPCFCSIFSVPTVVARNEGL